MEASSPATLPLRTVRLYETGVGYFEREGEITGSSESLPVPASHVDDALKTLVILSSQGPLTVSGVEFDSVLSRGLARSMAALPLDSDKPVTYSDVLESLRGVDVMLATANEEVVGKLVEVVAAPPKASEADKPKPPDEPAWYLTIVMQTGAVRRFRSSDLVSVMPSDPALAARLSSAVAALSGRAAQIRRSLRILTQGSARVRLGYVAETPVFRPTYRLVVDPSGGAAKLQAWALIHNDTDEAWSGVHVELVHGRPESFLFPLSAPRYTKRQLAFPESELSTVPQLADQTPDQIWGDHAEREVATGTGSGYGIGYGRLGGSHRVKAPQLRMGMTSVTTSESDGIHIGDLAQVAGANAVEAGALFDYRLAGQVDLRAHGSALVPFAEANLDARPLTWFDSTSDQGRSAVRIVNTSPQTLPAGPIAVYESVGFSGETALGRLKPKERAFLRYGVDLDAELTAEKEKASEDVQKVFFDGTQLIEHFVRHTERTYELVNRGGEPREMGLVLDIVKNAKLSGFDGADFDQESQRPVALFKVDPRKRVDRDVSIDEALERTSNVSNLTGDGLDKLSVLTVLAESDRAVLKASAALLRKVEANDKDKAALEKDQAHVNEDLERVRQHLTALGDKSGAAAGANPLVTRILELEDRLGKTRKRLEDLETERQKQMDAVTAELKKLATK
jgi:hypothetical protein